MLQEAGRGQIVSSAAWSVTAGDESASQLQLWLRLLSEPLKQKKDSFFVHQIVELCNSLQEDVMDANSSRGDWKNAWKSD